MALIHKQVVQRMRARLAGQACLPMSNLALENLGSRARVGAERVGSWFSTRPLKAQVGAVLGVHHVVSMNDVRDCAEAVKTVIDRLDSDLIRFFNDRWFQMIKKGEEPSEQEKDYERRWISFKLDFDYWKKNEVDSCCIDDLGAGSCSSNPILLASKGCWPGPLYDQCSAWNDQHDAWYDSFQKDFNGVTSGPKNQKIRQQELNLPNPLDIIPWKTILFGGFALAGFALWTQRKLPASQSLAK